MHEKQNLENYSEKFHCRETNIPSNCLHDKILTRNHNRCIWFSYEDQNLNAEYGKLI